MTSPTLFEYSPPPTADPTFVEIDGIRYGACADSRGPIGGGAGYASAVTQGDHTATTVEHLAAAIAASREGETIFLPGDCVIDCTTLVHIHKLVFEVPGGVTIASDRGINGSPGALIFSDTFDTKPLFRALGPRVRLTGLRICGPDPKIRAEHNDRAFNRKRDMPGDFANHSGSAYYYRFPVASGIETRFDWLEVDNCEMCAFSHRAIGLVSGKGHRVHHCTIHHNQYEGLGYGVSLQTAEAVIERNLFYANRHSIAGTGETRSGYEAMHNVVFHETGHHCFDMHGGEDRGDGTDVAGTWLKIHHNYFDTLCSRSVMIRGSTQEEAVVDHNWWSHASVDKPVHRRSRARVFDNAYRLDAPSVLDAGAE